MGDAEMNAPLVKSMDRLEEGETFVFRQLTQYAELFLPYDQQNKYMLSAAPEGVKAASSQHDGAMWKPTGAELRGTSPIFLAYEMSNFMQRCLFGCLGAKNLRPFDMNFVNSQMAMKLDAEGWRNIKENKDVLEDDDGFRISRPCKCGGCCLEPFVTFVRSAQNNDVGFVRENFEPYSEKCFLATCKCTHVHDVFVKSKTPTYQLVVNGACCGAHNNCCGATCFKEAMIFDILDTNGKVVGHVQKSFAREDTGCYGGVCRACHDFSNYIVTMPQNASVEEKQALLGALVQIEYLYFSPKDNDNDN